MQVAVGVCRSSLLACFAALISLPALAQTVTVTPTSASFGNQVEGTSSSTHKITLKNGQSSAITIASITTSLSDYAATNTCPISPATLAASGTCTISIAFTPSALGTRSGTLTVVDSGGSSPQLVTLSGTGTAPSLVSIAVTPTTSSVAAGYTQQFTATGTYSNGTTQNLTTTASWTSSNTSVATIKVQTGLATSVAQGTTTITAKSGTISGMATLTVTAPVLTSIAVTPSTASVAAGNAKQFTATGTYSNGTTQNLTSSVSWSSSATSIATVSSAGLATSLAQGSATITATSGTISGSATLTVTAAVLASIAVTPATASVAAGYTQQFTATGTYSNGTTQNLTTTASWTSSNTSVATIKVHSGLATSVAQGTTTITATSGTISGTATLAVTAPVLTSIAVTPSTASVAAGNAKQFTATGTYSNSTTQNLTSSVSWSSSATSIATISSAGLATSLAQGSATITATSGAISGSATLTVTAAVLASIAVIPATASVAAGYTQQFTATGIYSNGKTKNLSSTVTWTSSATVTATVSVGGLAVGVAQGGATISASSGTVSGSAALSVTLPVLTGISISPGSATIAEGMSQQFTATGTYSDGSTQNLTGTVSWSATAGAVISSSGSATGVGIGAATITASSGSITASATLNVGPPVLVSMAVTPANPSFALGTTQQLAATGTYSDGSTLDLTNAVTWSAGNGSVATVNGQGLASSVALGSGSVTATSGSITGSTTVTVTPAVLVSIAVTPAIPVIPLGTTQQFTATGTYTDGSTQNITGTVEWSSDTPTVATISNTAGSQGEASSAAEGTATITASVGTVSGSTTLSVTSATLVSLAITPASVSLALGTTQQFTAIGTFTDGSTQNLTSTVTWSSDTVSTATINNAGLASSVGTGSANITASSGSVSSTTVLTVTAAALVSIAINPPAATIPLGMTQQFTATGTDTDGSTQDLTQSGHWSSSVAGVATISNSTGTAGLATTLGTGTTTIGISSGGVNAAVPLVVNPAALATIAITPQAPTIALGTSQQFTAMGTYTDGSTQDVTTVVTWSSSNAMVAIISNSSGSFGLATSSGQGTATITAASASIFSSTPITVGSPALVSIVISPTGAAIPLGTSQQFSATGTYTDGSSQDVTASVIWASDSPMIAPVSAVGLVTGSAMGTANISATSGTVTSSTSAAVTPPLLLSISISPGSATIAEGMSQQYAATGTYSDGSTQNLTGTVSWSATAGAAISSSGSATGVGIGAATITASSGSITASATLNVGPPVLVSIAVTPANPSFALGTTQQLAATGTYSDGSTLDLTNAVTWSAGNGSVATVNGQGLASSVALGSGSVTATSGSITGSTTVTVTPAVLVSIAVTPAIPVIPLGTTQQFTATGTYTDGSTQNITGTVEWSSDTPTVATISNTAGSQGGASSEGEGTATITASVGTVSGSTTLSVTSATLVSLAITPASVSLALGTTQQFTAIGTFTDGSTQNLTSTVTWSSDTVSTATINNAGLASSVGTGSANITASSGSVSSTTVLTVTAAALVSIAINPPAATIPLGMTQQFTASGTYTDGSTQDLTQSGHWSSTVAGVATISNSSGTAGLATTLGTGTTTIGISSGGVNAAVPLVVNPAALATIAITPQAPTIALGTSQQFTAMGTYTDGSTQDVTTVVTWSSSNAMVAIISNSSGSFGLATSSGQGTATITAASASVSSSTSITVGQASVSSIAVTPASISISVGYAEQFTAVATYSDGSSHDITQSATWTSSTPDVAAVNSTGLAIGMLAGMTTVSASAGSVTGSASLTVSSAQTVNTNAQLFGLHIQSTSTPWPAIGFNEVRLWSNESGARWAQINTSNGAYNFAVLDIFLAEFYRNGITDVVYTFGQVPKWASSNQTDSTCDYATSSPLYGGCDLPKDINIDGTGTDQTYKTFVAAIAAHVNNPTYLLTHAHIRYWEPWNEWHRNNIVSTYKWTDFSIRASYAQMVRMVEDVRCTITGTGSVNGIPCSAPPIDTTAMILSPSSGGESCCSEPQVFQNFLYCNGAGSNAPISGSYCTTGTAGSAAVDIINSHWYEGEGREPEDLATDVPVYTSLLSSTDLAKPLWSDEGSWNNDTYVSDPDIQASWVARYYLVGWSTSLVRMYWYAYDSPLYGTLWTAAGGLDPAGQAYNTVYQWIVGSTLTTRCANTSGTIWTCGIKLANGNSAEAIWDTSQTCADGSCSTRNQSVSPTWTSYQDLTGTVHAIPSGTVPVGIQPILLLSSSGT